MRDVEREWFELKVQGHVLTKRGTAFQDFFADFMEKLHPSDFERVRPYGRKGDRKCDGFQRSSGTVFQVYAPREMKEAVLLKKIREDFAGALVHWKQEMRAWTFVHNDDEGLPADVVKELEALRAKNSTLAIDTWSCSRVQSECMKLARPALITFCGRPPARADFDQLTFEPIARVVTSIKGEAPQGLEEIQPVSVHKLEANALSPIVAEYLRLGRQREHLVEQYFERHWNPTFGDEVAGAFRAHYVELKSEYSEADQIFAALQGFAGGSTRGDVEHEAAVLAVLSYLFERCDIFEAPQVKAP